MKVSIAGKMKPYKYTKPNARLTIEKLYWKLFAPWYSNIFGTALRQNTTVVYIQNGP